MHPEPGGEERGRRRGGHKHSYVETAHKTLDDKREAKEPMEDGTAGCGSLGEHSVVASELFYTRSPTNSGVRPTASTCHCEPG